MKKSLLLAFLLSTAAVPAFAADMPLKAPRPAEVIYNDWSGIYTGVAVGGAWGREKLSNDLSSFDTATASSQLFGTSTARIFNGTAAIIQPPFSMSDCLITNCNSAKMSGLMAGGFAGAQKQLGNWVIGIEGSWDWLGAKKSFSASEDTVQNVTRFLPQTSVLVPGQTVAVTGTALVPGQVALGQTTGPAPVSVLVPGQTALGATTGPAPIAGTATIAPVTATINSPVSISVLGQTVSVGVAGTASVPGQTAPVTGLVVGPSPVAVAVLPVVANGSTTGPGPVAVNVLPVTAPVTGTAVIPAQTLIINLPQATTVRALVTRSADLETKIDQIADLRGKFGLTNVFFGPNMLLYATGGASVGHFNKSLSISQTTSLCTTQTGACVTTGQPSRSDTFSATSGDTRLGWVVGAGLDWKVTQNFVLGALYRHHEFPKGTVAFNEGTNSLGFGTSRVTVDSVQARASWLFPIQ